jgi:hypothetical protein
MAKNPPPDVPAVAFRMMSFEPKDTFKFVATIKPPPSPVSAWPLEMFTVEFPAISTPSQARKPPPFRPVVTF